MIKTITLTISIAITFFVATKHVVIVSALEDRNTELLSRLIINTSLCLQQYKSENKYKKEIKLLKRSLTAVRRNLAKDWVAYKEQQGNLYGKGGDY